MAGRDETQLADEIQKSLPPELSLLLSAMRAEFDAKLTGAESRLLLRIGLMGIPLGALGGFVAEYMKPGAVHQTASAVIGLLT